MAERDQVHIRIVTEAQQAVNDLKKFALGMTAAYAAVKKAVDIGKDLVNAYREDELAFSKLNAALKATGGAVGLSSTALEKMANSLEEVTRFSNATNAEAEGILLTFTKIGGNIFPEVLERAQDMSEMFGQDLSSSAVQLGKALNDPKAGLTALSRIGISFTAEQKKLIDGFMKTNDVASAQRVILDELSREIGGVARAAAESGAGAFDKFENAVSRLKVSGGQMIANFAGPFIENLSQTIFKLTDAKRLMEDVTKIWNKKPTQNTPAADLESQISTLQEYQAALQKSIDTFGKWQPGKGFFFNVFEQAKQFTAAANSPIYSNWIRSLDEAKTKEEALQIVYEQRKKVEAEIAEKKRLQAVEDDAIARAHADYLKTDQGKLDALREELKYYQDMYPSLIKAGVAYDQWGREVLVVVGNLEEQITKAEEALKPQEESLDIVLDSVIAHQTTVELLNEELDRFRLLRGATYDQGQAVLDLGDALAELYAMPREEMFAPEDAQAIYQIVSAAEVLELQLAKLGLSTDDLKQQMESMLNGAIDGLAGMILSTDSLAVSFQRFVGEIAANIGKMLIAAGVKALFIPGAEAAGLAMIIAGLGTSLFGGAMQQGASDAAAAAAGGAQSPYPVANEDGEIALASGGIVTQPTRALVGESGPEAVIPLSRLGGASIHVHFHGPVSDKRQFEAIALSAYRRAQRGY